MLLRQLVVVWVVVLMVVLGIERLLLRRRGRWRREAEDRVVLLAVERGRQGELFSERAWDVHRRRRRRQLRVIRVTADDDDSLLIRLLRRVMLVGRRLVIRRRGGLQRRGGLVVSVWRAGRRSLGCRG